MIQYNSQNEIYIKENNTIKQATLENARNVLMNECSDLHYISLKNCKIDEA